MFPQIYLLEWSEVWACLHKKKVQIVPFFFDLANLHNMVVDYP